MRKETDMLLARCCRCSSSALADTAEVILNSIDKAEAEGDDRTAQLYIDISRVLDAIGELRFSERWPAMSPARKRDALRFAFPLGKA